MTHTVQPAPVTFQRGLTLPDGVSLKLGDDADGVLSASGPGVSVATASLSDDGGTSSRDLALESGDREYTGSSGTGGGSGAVAIESGDTTAATAGGTGGDSGAVTIASGASAAGSGTSGNSGAVTISTGNSGGGNVGNLTLRGGNSSGGGSAGSIVLDPGASAGGNGSVDILQPGDDSAITRLDTGNVSTSTTRTVVMPDHNVQLGWSNDAEIADPGNGNAIDVSRGGTCVLTAAGAGETRPLGRPVRRGQTLTLYKNGATGDIDVTVTGGIDVAGNTGINLNDAGDNITLIGSHNGTDLIWLTLNNDGPTLS